MPSPGDILNPILFGAAGNGTTDDAGAIQDMFDFISTSGHSWSVDFLGLTYRIDTTVTLPRISRFVTITLRGSGASLRTTNAITIFARTATSNTVASAMVSGSTLHIDGFEFVGDGQSGQIGLAIDAAYSPVVSNCHFLQLDRGIIGTFVLGGTWSSNRFTLCKTRPFTLRSGLGDPGAASPAWPSADQAFTASNCNTVQNCRVYAPASGQRAAYCFYGGTDGTLMLNNISEGQAIQAGVPRNLYDVEIDYQNSPIARNFDILGLHCESESSQVNLRIKARGVLRIDGLVRSYPAAICDPSGSQAIHLRFGALANWSNLPTTGFWFYHTDGGGFGGTASGNSADSTWTFTDYTDQAGNGARTQPKWEGPTGGPYPGTLPVSLFVLGHGDSGQGPLMWASHWLNTTGMVLEGRELFKTDAAYDIGAVSSTRPAKIYAAHWTEAKFTVTTPSVVAGLGNLGTPLTGARGYVTDSTVPASGNFGATVVGGGSNPVPVFYDGSGWKIG